MKKQNNPYPKATKTSLDLTIDLFHSLRIIKDSLEMLNKGNYYQIGVIYTQLRSLLTDKSSKGVSPLLPLISNKLEVDLNFYFRKAIPIIKSAHFEYINHELSIEKATDKHTEINIVQYLEETAIIVEGQQVKVKELIGHLANSYGGAHYSKNVPEYIFKLMPFKFGNETIINNYVIQLAEFCMQLGIKVLKKISDFNIYLFIFLPYNVIDKEFAIIDFKHKHTYNRISLLIKNNKFYFSLVDSIGNQFLKPCNNSIEINNHYLVNLTHILNEDFKSSFKTYVNGEIQINEIEDNPFLFLNRLIQYDRYINKYYNGENNEFEFGLIYFSFMDKEINEGENNENYNQMMDKIDTKVATWLGKGVFGYCKSGETTLEIEGGKSINIEEYIKSRKKD